MACDSADIAGRQPENGRHPERPVGDVQRVVIRSQNRINCWFWFGFAQNTWFRQPLNILSGRADLGHGWLTGTGVAESGSSSIFSVPTSVGQWGKTHVNDMSNSLLEESGYKLLLRPESFVGSVSSISDSLWRVWRESFC
jgi:hypothetical protein